MHVILITLCVAGVYSEPVETTTGDDTGHSGIFGGIGQLFESMGSILDSLEEGGSCRFVCSNGAKPLPKPNHVPTTNGCGSLGVQLDTAMMPEMTRCCDVHDKCYDTCNSDRDQCDVEFKNCMNQICEHQSRGRMLTGQQKKGCQSAVHLTYAGVVALGCRSYKDAQAAACECKNAYRHENPIYNDM